MSTELKQKELDYTLLAMAMLLVIVLFLLFGCTTTNIPQPSAERARQTQYQVKFIGSDALLFRNGKLINRQPSGIFTRDTVRTEIKTTTERY